MGRKGSTSKKGSTISKGSTIKKGSNISKGSNIRKGTKTKEVKILGNFYDMEVNEQIDEHGDTKYVFSGSSEEFREGEEYNEAVDLVGFSSEPLTQVKADTIGGGFVQLETTEEDGDIDMVTMNTRPSLPEGYENVVLPYFQSQGYRLKHKERNLLKLRRKTKTDWVQIADLHNLDSYSFPKSKLPKERIYLFKVGNEFYQARGTGVSKKLKNNSITIDEIKKFKKVDELSIAETSSEEIDTSLENIGSIESPGQESFARPEKFDSEEDYFRYNASRMTDEQKQERLTKIEANLGGYEKSLRENPNNKIIKDAKQSILVEKKIILESVPLAPKKIEKEGKTYTKIFGSTNDKEQLEKSLWNYDFIIEEHGGRYHGYVNQDQVNIGTGSNKPIREEILDVIGNKQAIKVSEVYKSIDASKSEIDKELEILEHAELIDLQMGLDSSDLSAGVKRLSGSGVRDMIINRQENDLLHNLTSTHEVSGLRGLDAEIEAIDYFDSLGKYSKIKNVSHDRDIHADIELTQDNKKLLVEVKEINETVSSGSDQTEKGRAQIEKDYIKSNKTYLFKVNYNDGSIKWFQSGGRKVKRLLKDNKSPAKLTLNEIEKFNEISKLQKYRPLQGKELENRINELVELESKNTGSKLAEIQTELIDRRNQRFDELSSSGPFFAPGAIDRKTSTQIQKENFLEGYQDKQSVTTVSGGYGLVLSTDTDNKITPVTYNSFSKSLVDKSNRWKSDKRKEAREIYSEKGYDGLVKAVSKKKIPKTALIELKAYQDIQKNTVILRKYDKDHKIPFYQTHRGRAHQFNLVDPKRFNEVKKNNQRKVVVEKMNLSKDELQGLDKDKDILKLGGQNLQASIDNDLRFRGLFFQDIDKDRIEKHYGDFEYISLKDDKDPAGHYSAYMINYYIHDDPLIKNVDFGRGELESPDEFLAMKFFTRQIITSSGHRKSKIVGRIIKNDFQSSLKFRHSDGQTSDLELSDEKFAIVDKLTEKKTMLRVQTPEQEIVFDYKLQDIDDNFKPTLVFKSDNVHRPLNSNVLLQVAVDRLNLEPDQAQSIIESLYHAGWINYPRADEDKAQDQPIFTIRDTSKFQGTYIEKEILNIIEKSESDNYVKEGIWILEINGKELTSTGGFLTGHDLDENNKFILQDNEYDIDIINQGLSQSRLTEFMSQSKVNTPATQTQQLRLLKDAGIITIQKDGMYNVDKRGLIMASANRFYKQNNNFNAVDLKLQLENVQYGDYEGLKKILESIQPIDQQEAYIGIVRLAQEEIEKQDDLAYLDSL